MKEEEQLRTSEQWFIAPYTQLGKGTLETVADFVATVEVFFGFIEAGKIDPEKKILQFLRPSSHEVDIDALRPSHLKPEIKARFLQEKDKRKAVIEAQCLKERGYGGQLYAINVPNPPYTPLTLPYLEWPADGLPIRDAWVSSHSWDCVYWHAAIAIGEVTKNPWQFLLRQWNCIDLSRVSVIDSLYEKGVFSVSYPPADCGVNIKLVTD
mgnify:CR=1 FL=1